MKYYSLLFLVLLITSCSNEWEEHGFSESQEQNAKERGFENPLEYEAALELGIDNFDALMIYRNGGFNDIEQFKYARRFKLNSLSDVNSHKKNNCVFTPTYGEVCTFDEMFNELGPKFEFHLERLNKAVDETEFEIALDCRTIKTPYKPRYVGGSWVGYEGHYRTIFLKLSGPLLYAKEKELLNNEFFPLNFEGNNIRPIHSDNRDAFRGLINVNDAMALMYFEQYRRKWSADGFANRSNDIPPHTPILAGNWQANDGFYHFHSNDLKHSIDRKTGIGEVSKTRTRINSWNLFQDEFICKAFEGDAKTLLKDNVFKPALTKIFSQQIEALNKKKAEELAKKKKEEERNSLDNKF